jgi:hypothetical protein
MKPLVTIPGVARSIAREHAPLKFALTSTSKKSDRPLGAL